MDHEYEADLLTLLDDEGQEHEFEIIDELENDDGHFLALVPTQQELDEFLDKLLCQYAPWAQRRIEWDVKRTQSLAALQFPFAQYRPGQRAMAGEIYRACRAGKTADCKGGTRLFCQAPTGIGKTMSALFPALKAMGEGNGEKLFYLTARNTTQTAAEDALTRLHTTQPELALRSVTLTAKEKVCLHPDAEGHPACLPELCPYANGYYDRVNTALKALLDDRLAALDKCKTGAEVQSCVDAFAAGVVDLLIDDAAGARLKELATKLKTIESAYNALDKTRQSLVTKYGKLAGMQQLYKQYTENLEALKKWYGQDCKRYDYIKKTVEKLYNGAVTQLGECTDKAAMDAVMNGYVVDIAEALTGDIAYKPGKTPASALKNLETRIKNARTAYNSLTAEQKQLFDKDLLASLQGAESLLSAYNSGISSLSSRLQQDKKAYPDLSDKLERLASRARNAMDSSVDTSGILSALDRYAASVVDALIDDIGYVPDVMSESDAAVLRGKISRAQSAYNALTAAQKKLVKGVTALETAAARMAAYEENYKAAQRVVEFIKAIGTVTKDSYDAIKRATDAYNALTPVQKALVPQWAIDLLEEATAKYKELTAADDTVSAEQPAELPLDDLRTEEAAKPDRPFDWTIIWMGAGILAALGIIVLLWKWFSATKQARRRNDE